jgi:hypothetical protein
MLKDIFEFSAEIMFFASHLAFIRYVIYTAFKMLSFGLLNKVGLMFIVYTTKLKLGNLFL